MSIAVIINPVSGGARRDKPRRQVALALGVIAAYGEQADVRVTERRGHARELAADAAGRGARLVLAWGGDGTVNEVASALVSLATPLGIVPGGSGNALASELGISRRPERAIRDALAATPRTIDAGELGGRLFFATAGVGFDARVADCFDRDTGRRGFRTYARIAVRELVTYRPATYRIGTDAELRTRRAFLVTLANASGFGNGTRIAPRARLDDGRLDLVVYEERSRAGTILALPRLFTGGAARVKGLSIEAVTRVTIEADAPLTFHVDGEPVRGGPCLEARVRPGALRVCAA